MIQQLLPMNQNESIYPPRRNEPRGNRRLAKSGRSTDDTFIVNNDLGNGLLLERSQLPTKLGFDPGASIALVSNLSFNQVSLEKRFKIG